MNQMTQELNNFESYNWNGIGYGESYLRSLFDYVRAHPFKDGLEVGFDVGGSALAFLRGCTEARLLSIDIALCGEGNARLRTSDVTDRFSFRCCDSRVDMVEMVSQYGEKCFDFIYIDGDHLFDVALQDLRNADKLLMDGGYMIVDDADINHQHFGVGRAVDQFCNENNYQKSDLGNSPSHAVILRRK